MRLPGIGIGTIFNKVSGASLNPATLDWETWVIANGGTIDPAILQVFNDEFFQPADDNGNILTELDRFHFYAGTGNQIASRTNLIKNAHFVTPVSSPVWSNTGYKSAGAGSYLDLNYNANTQGVKLTQNSINHGVVMKNPNYSSVRVMGCIESGRRIDLYREATVQLAAFNSSGTAVNNTNIATSGFVFLAGIRTASTTESANINSNSVAGSSTSGAMPNGNIFELSTNVVGTGAIADFDTLDHYASWHGSKDLDYATFMTLVTNTLTALGL